MLIQKIERTTLYRATFQGYATIGTSHFTALRSMVNAIKEGRVNYY